MILLNGGASGWSRQVRDARHHYGIISHRSSKNKVSVPLVVVASSRVPARMCMLLGNLTWIATQAAPEQTILFQS